MTFPPLLAAGPRSGASATSCPTCGKLPHGAARARGDPPDGLVVHAHFAITAHTSVHIGGRASIEPASLSALRRISRSLAACQRSVLTDRPLEYSTETSGLRRTRRNRRRPKQDGREPNVRDNNNNNSSSSSKNRNAPPL